MQTVEEIQLQGGSGSFVAADLADAASIARLAKEVGDIDDRSPHDETRFARPFAFAPERRAWFKWSGIVARCATSASASTLLRWQGLLPGSHDKHERTLE